MNVVYSVVHSSRFGFTEFYFFVIVFQDCRRKTLWHIAVPPHLGSRKPHTAIFRSEQQNMPRVKSTVAVVSHQPVGSVLKLKLHVN